MSGIRSVLIVRSAFGELYELAWQRALLDLGIRTEVFDTHELIPKNVIGRVEEHILWGPHIRRVNSVLPQIVQNQRPDVTLFYQGHHFKRKTIESVGLSSFPCGCHCDDPFGRADLAIYRHLLESLPAYEGYHVNRACNIAEARARGVRRAKVLMQYYLPWAHFPCKPSHDELRNLGSDIVFAGHMEPDIRVECVTTLVRQGVKFRVFGGEAAWSRALPADVYNKIRPTPNVRGDLYRKALCSSKIGACFFSKWNRDQYTNRSWEIPACGLFLLAERTSAMQEFYQEGKESEFFSSLDEFSDKARFYIANDAPRRRIAEAGYRRVIASGHDIHSRMRQWLSDVGDWRNEATHQ